VRGRRWLGAKAVGSTGCDARSSSLQRMVRRFRGSLRGAIYLPLALCKVGTTPQCNGKCYGFAPRAVHGFDVFNAISFARQKRFDCVVDDGGEGEEIALR